MEKKETIVILSHVGFDNSPYCNYVHSHAKALAEQGYHVIVFAIINWIPLLSRLQKRKKDFMKKMKGKNSVQTIDGVNVIYKKAISFSNLFYNSKLNINGFFYFMSMNRIFKKLYQENNVILLDAHTYKMEGYVAYRFKKKYKDLTTTVTLHGTSFFRNTRTKSGRERMKKILNGVDHSVCVSHKILKIAKECGVKNAKVIYNGINQHEFSNVNKENYKYNMISVGSLIPRKNHNISIEVVKQLYQEYPNIKLNIVGFGSEETKLKELVVENHLENVVSFKGQVSNDEVLDMMNQSNIFLLPSVAEGFGIVYAEAMKAKDLVIGTKSEGIDGFIKNAENGFLVNIDPNEIVNLIKEIYSGKYDLEKIRENAYHSSKELTWKNNASEYLKLIKKKQ